MDVNLLEIIQGVPPVTRVYVGAAFCFCGLVYCGLISNEISQWGLSFSKVFNYGQPYRLITAFLCSEKYDWSYLVELMRMQWTLSRLEQNSVSSSDFLWYFILLLNATYLVTYLAGLEGDSALITSTVRDAASYLYLRKFPDEELVFILVVVKAKHLYLGILFSSAALARHKNIVSMCAGYFAGHILFVLDELVPHVIRGANLTLPPWKWAPVKRILSPVVQLAREHGLVKDNDQVQQRLLQEVEDSLAAVHEEQPLLHDDDNDNDDIQEEVPAS